MPMIGGSSSAAGGRPTIAPNCSPKVYQPMMTTMVQARADQKNTRGFGKNETNTGKLLPLGESAGACRGNGQGRFAVRFESQRDCNGGKSFASGNSPAGAKCGCRPQSRLASLRLSR